ncbi:MAG: dihydroorotase [Burkholderiaceae bacterium]|nr:dihydroorotase [Burkholderiaceae bacterium]
MTREPATPNPVPQGSPALGQRLRLREPDDWHLHLRDGAMLKAVAPYSARQCGRALVMPNLQPPVVTVAMAEAYARRIAQALSGEKAENIAERQAEGFRPFMALYLTDNTSCEEVDRAAQSPHVLAFKLYPAGATTHSDAGVTNLQALDAVFERMAEQGVVLCIHGEVTSPEVDVFDREARFIEEHLIALRNRHPELRIVFEHATTCEAVDYVREARGPIAATITPQHLLYNRNALFRSGLRPHYYCLPVLKREPHRQALVAAVISGNPRFFMGTDSAPHDRTLKEADCGCAGCFSAPFALELYAQVFDEAKALDKLEAFASHFGADFYGLPRNAGQVELLRQDHCIADRLSHEGHTLVPLAAGQVMRWQYAGRVEPSLVRWPSPQVSSS